MATLLRLLSAGLPATVLVIRLALPSAVVAHGGITAGPYELELSWRTEPAVAGQPNAVRVAITERETGQPVTDLVTGALVVTIATAGHDSSTVPLSPAVNAGSGGGQFGIYEAAFVPDAAGQYSFHVTGSIHETDVDGTLENVVDAAAGAPVAEPGPDQILLVGGGVVLALLAVMAFLLLRVRSVPPPRAAPVPVPSKRKPSRRPPSR